MSDNLSEIPHISSLKVLLGFLSFEEKASSITTAMSVFFALTYEIFPTQFSRSNPIALGIHTILSILVVNCTYRTETQHH